MEPQRVMCGSGSKGVRWPSHSCHTIVTRLVTCTPSGESGDASVAEDYTHLYYVRKQASHSTFATNPSSFFSCLCFHVSPIMRHYPSKGEHRIMSVPPYPQKKLFVVPPFGVLIDSNDIGAELPKEPMIWVHCCHRHRRYPTQLPRPLYSLATKSPDAEMSDDVWMMRVSY